MTGSRLRKLNAAKAAAKDIRVAYSVVRGIESISMSLNPDD